MYYFSMSCGLTLSLLEIILDNMEIKVCLKQDNLKKGKVEIA
jgi:hypothetical protein